MCNTVFLENHLPIYLVEAFYCSEHFRFSFSWLKKLTFIISAIACHKYVISFCVGLELCNARTRLRIYSAYMIIFAIMSPIGIGKLCCCPLIFFLNRCLIINIKIYKIITCSCHVFTNLRFFSGNFFTKSISVSFKTR